MEPYDYTWKIGFEFSSNISLQTSKPLTYNTVLTDLYDGNQYAVQVLHQARPVDKACPSMPDTVAVTVPVGVLPENELTKLRERAGYAHDEFSQPRADVVFSLA